MDHQRRIAILTDIDQLNTGAFDSIGLRSAFVLTQLGFAVTLVATTPPDSDPSPLRAKLASSGIDSQHISPGGTLGLPIDEMFGSDCCLVDIANVTRFRFLADLPVHTWPGARLAGVIDRLAGADEVIAREIIERLDAVTGSLSAAISVMSISDENDLRNALQQTMQTANLRHALLQSDRGDLIQIGRSSSERLGCRESATPPPLERAVAASCAALALRLSPPEALRVAAGLQDREELSPRIWERLVAEAQIQPGL